MQNQVFVAPKKKKKPLLNAFPRSALGWRSGFGRDNKTQKYVEKLPEINYTKECVEVPSGIFLLPDDILELCLDLLPFEGLKNVRLVCKNWSSFLTTERILQITDTRCQNLWLFVFGALIQPFSPLDYHVIIIHAPDLSHNQWHI